MVNLLLVLMHKRKTEIYLGEKCDLWTELLPLCGIFPVSRAAQETKNAFILWKGIGSRARNRNQRIAQ